MVIGKPLEKADQNCWSGLSLRQLEHVILASPSHSSGVECGSSGLLGQASFGLRAQGGLTALDGRNSARFNNLALATLISLIFFAIIFCQEWQFFNALR